MSKTQKNRLLAIAIILFTPLVYFGLLFTTCGLGAFEDDLIQYFPNIAWLGQQLHAGNFPFWNSLVYGGYPQISDPQSGVLYPLNWISAVLPMRWTYPLLLIVHYWLAGMGMYWLGRQWGVSRGAAVFGAVAWMFSGFMLGHRTHYTILASAAWMSVIFYLWSRIRDSKHPQIFWVAVIFCQAMQILAGQIQVAMMSGAAVFFYLLFTLESRRVRCWILFASSYVLTFGLVAVQLLPVWQLYAESVRSANSYLFVTENSFFPMAWTLLFAPASLGLRVPNFLYDQAYFGPWNHCELNCFTTLVALTVAVFTIRNVRRNPNRRRIVIFLIVLGGLAIFLALGRYNPAFKLLYQLPIFRPFRCPARYLLWFNFAVAALAMVGLQSLHILDMREKFRKFALKFIVGTMTLFVAYLAVMAIVARRSSLTEKLPASLAKLPQAIKQAIVPDNPAIFIPLMIGAVTIACSLRVSRQLTRVLLVLLLIEIATIAPFYDFYFDRIERVNLQPPIAKALDKIASKRDGFIWPLSKDPYIRPLENLQPFTNMLVNRPSITGYGPLLNKYHRRLFNWELWPTTGNYLGIINRPAMLDRYNIRYILADPTIASQIEVLRAFSSVKGPAEPYSEELSETAVVQPGSAWRHRSMFPEGLYQIRFTARRLSSDQLRMYVRLSGLPRLWTDQQFMLNTWDMDQEWRAFEWTFFIPENAPKDVELSISNDYGVCEIKEIALRRTPCDFSAIRLVTIVDKVSLYENTKNYGFAWFARSAKLIEERMPFASKRMKTADDVLFSDQPEVTWLASRNRVILPEKLGSGRILSSKWKTSSVSMDVRVGTGPAVLVMPAGYNDQWRAMIDGFESPVFCADGISRAVLVPPGEHTVFLAYIPEMFQAGLAVGAFTVLLMIFIFTVGLNVREE